MSRDRVLLALALLLAVPRSAFACDSTGCLRRASSWAWASKIRSEYQGERVESTGGTIVYAIPGLVTTLPGRSSLYFFLPMPGYRYVNETQVAPHLSLVLGVARSF